MSQDIEAAILEMARPSTFGGRDEPPNEAAMIAYAVLRLAGSIDRFAAAIERQSLFASASGFAGCRHASERPVGGGGS